MNKEYEHKKENPLQYNDINAPNDFFHMSNEVYTPAIVCELAKKFSQIQSL